MAANTNTRHGSRFIDLTGQRFGRLRAYSYAYVYLSTGRRMPAWLCICDCGNKKIIQGHHLRGGKSQSCGCAWSEEKKPGGDRKKWPGHGIWWQMINRCENPNVKGYKYYGARGISVCDRWRRGDGERPGFECFFEDMGPPPKGLSLDRIDPNGNYEPSNCRWATDAQQRANTRRSINALIGGVKVPLTKYAARLGLDYERMRVRVRKDGMTIKQAARAMLATLVLSIGLTGHSQRAEAHDWYPIECCSGTMDCREVDGPQASERLSSVQVMEQDGAYVISTTGERLGQLGVDRRVKASPDGAFHWCSQKGKDDTPSICLFVPPNLF